MLVAGAGMAGLVCAVRARELGLRPRVIEKGSRAGGSMLLSSGVIWRHRDFADFRAECPGGDESLQRLIWERLDDALAWLVAAGAEPVRSDTENPRTTGKRFDPRALTRLLAADVELETALPADPVGPVVLATGGFAKRLAGEHGLLLRANPWSDGAGLDHATARGGGVTRGLEEFYGRVMPAPPAQIGEKDFVPAAQLYGRWARIYTEDGRDITPASVSWSENDLARLVGPRAWYVLDADGLERANDRVEAARAAGGTVIDAAELPFATPAGSHTAVHVAAAVTHTLGGIAVDPHARVIGCDGLYAAGVDVGGIAVGGYASGLAQALVLGLVAAESVYDATR